MQQRRKGTSGKCTLPTTQQLQDIAQRIASNSNRIIKWETVREELQTLASLLREYRIYIRGGSFPANSLDAVVDGEYNSLLDKFTDNPNKNLEEHDEQAEFLQFYHQQLQVCLKQALAQVTESRVQQLQCKKGDQAQQFLTAIELSQQLLKVGWKNEDVY